MALKVEITAEAASDLEEIFAWTRYRWSPEQAQKYISKLKSAIVGLERHPRKHALAPDGTAFDVEVRQLVCGRHRILYSIQPSVVVVLHVRHMSREPLA